MSESIKVVCRVRPLNSNEINLKSKSCLAFPPSTDNAVVIQGRTFTFDRVLQHTSTQSTVYEVVAKPIVADVLSGYNGTIFAYGQTASGKTFTMEGVLGDPEYQGIIPRIIHDIFDHIYTMDENLEFHIKVSYFEIYLDKIRDLLDVSKTNLSVHEDKDRVPFVKGATERFVSSPEEVFDVIDEGKANRHVSVTNMNEHSSRSHSVFMIQVKQENLETQKKLHGKLYLVDLAGSEKVAKTGAEGTVLDEAKNINKSLSALGNVINALVEGSAHIPYRDSKLTRILQESLGGNARTTMVICCSPAEFNDAETKSTLMFGMRAKTIKNCVSVNEELTAEEWRRRYEKEKQRNKQLKAIIIKLEAEIKKWRQGERISQNEWFTESQYNQVAEEVKEMTNSQLGSISASTDSLNKLNPDVSSQKPRPAQIGESASVNELYRLLDDKDDEINKHAQLVERLKQQIEEQDELIKSLRQDQERTQGEFNRLQSENESSKEEVKEVLQALEELAMNYDQKIQEIQNRTHELEDMQEQFNQQNQSINSKENELQQLKENYVTQKKKYAEMFNSLIKDLGDVGECMSDQLSKPSFAGIEKIDEEFTVIRLYISKMKTEAKTTQSRVRQLEDERLVQHQNLKKTDEELRDMKLKVQEFEVRMNTLNNKVDETESQKRKLEELIDQLNAEVSKFKANEQLIVNANAQNRAEILAGQLDIKSKLDEEFKRQSEQYSQQIKELRDKLDEKQRISEEMKDKIHHLSFQNEKLKEEYEKVVADGEVKAAKLEGLEKAAEKREQARQDLKGLEDTVMKELQTLHNLRKLFVQDLSNRVKKSTRGVNRDSGIIGEDDDDDDSRSGNLVQKQKIQFLEMNLEQLTKVHKQLVRDNSDLRLELPKLEKRLKSTTDRVKALESALKDAKEGAMRDRRRYQHEVDRIKEAVRQRNIARRGPAAQIAKPIRAGHAPGAPQMSPQIATPAIRGGGATNINN